MIGHRKNGRKSEVVAIRRTASRRDHCTTKPKPKTQYAFAYKTNHCLYGLCTKTSASENPRSPQTTTQARWQRTQCLLRALAVCTTRQHSPRCFSATRKALLRALVLLRSLLKLSRFIPKSKFTTLLIQHGFENCPLSFARQYICK